MSGFVIYKGPSVLDGAPIVAIATLKTSNRKTGAMVQTWILRDDVNPVDAAKTGADASICGGCVQRHYVGGACYVNIGQAPATVWKAYQRGAYGDYAPSLARGRAIRLGAYGDPAAVPFEVWARFLGDAQCTNWTGYTHQARHKNFDPRILRFCMASADTPKHATKLQSMGARTFRVKKAGDTFANNEIECLADSKGIACIDCGACNGAGDAPNIAVIVHGSRVKRYENLIAKTG